MRRGGQMHAARSATATHRAKPRGT